MEVVKHFKQNTQGIDYAVGDIHGCFSILQAKLDSIGFNPSIDRLFSVGDLVDRGPESEEFWDYLRKPWFHAVRGNHEDLVINSVKDDDNGNSAACHAANGGLWLYGLPEVEQQCYALEMEELPLAIEIETTNGLVGIIHAECPLGDWELFKSMYKENQYRFDAIAMWSRNKITKKDDSDVIGLHKLYVGHTPTNDVVCLGNVEYIDQGACFSGGRLTVKKIN